LSAALLGINRLTIAKIDRRRHRRARVIAGFASGLSAAPAGVMDRGE